MNINDIKKDVLRVAKENNIDLSHDDTYIKFTGLGESHIVNHWDIDNIDLMDLDYDYEWEVEITCETYEYHDNFILDKIKRYRVGTYERELE